MTLTSLSRRTKSLGKKISYDHFVTDVPANKAEVLDTFGVDV